MIFLQAFLVTGLVCAIAQFLVMKTKLGPMGTFTVLMVAGAALGLVGVFGEVVKFGMMGTVVTIAALCEQFFESFLLVFKGEFTSLLTFLAVLGTIVGFGAICGLVAKVPNKKKLD